MPVEQELNIILKEMWRIDEKSKEELTDYEKDFYATHLETIVSYYESNSAYWNSKK